MICGPSSRRRTRRSPRSSASTSAPMRVLRYVDLDEVEPDQDGTPHFGSVRQQLASISKDMPELLDFKLGAGSGGSKKPVLTQEKPLTREEVEKMSEEEVNSNWRRVQRFLQGERS